eukprot:613361-Alexandrium_andersonii.AAC.1
MHPSSPCPSLTQPAVARHPQRLTRDQHALHGHRPRAPTAQVCRLLHRRPPDPPIFSATWEPPPAHPKSLQGTAPSPVNLTLLTEPPPTSRECICKTRSSKGDRTLANWSPNISQPLAKCKIAFGPT